MEMRSNDMATEGKAQIRKAIPDEGHLVPSIPELDPAAGSFPYIDTTSEELGRFGRWWLKFFGRNRHSVSLDEIERFTQTSTNPFEHQLAFIIRRLTLTCGARFETARRHKKKNRTSIISIIILSMYAIFFSMAATVKSVPVNSKEILSMYSIFMATFILAFSVYESSKRYDSRSESFLRCAHAVQKLRDQATTTLVCGLTKQGDVQKIEAAYHELLSEYTDNHSFLDYMAHLASVGKVVGPRVLIIRMIYLLNIWFMPLIAIASPFVLFLMFRVVAFYADPIG